jgi:hypothetical protein
MFNPGRFLIEMGQKIFHKDEDFLAMAGPPVVLGQGLDEHRIQPRMTVHWHPPYSVMSEPEAVREKSRLRTLLSKMGVRRKTA